ncbi:MAG: hypothetical protein R2795_08220 [Saprospiraceae bacterium]
MEGMKDSLLFIQGMEGLQTAITIPGLADYAGRVVNKAELELHVAALPEEDLSYFPPLAQIIAMYKNDEGQLVTIQDVSISTALNFYFGGQPRVQEDGSYVYKINLSLHLQDVIDGKVDPVIYLVPFPRAGNAQRVILKGYGATDRPPVLNVNFTDF